MAVYFRLCICACMFDCVCLHVFVRVSMCSNSISRFVSASVTKIVMKQIRTNPNQL